MDYKNCKSESVKLKEWNNYLTSKEKKCRKMNELKAFYIIDFQKTKVHK